MLKALPIAGMEAQWFGIIQGLVPDKSIHLVEPPAEQHVPFTKAIDTIASLSEHAGKSLAEQLGEEVYYFADRESNIDDDDCHRFLALLFWCSMLPDSSFTRYLLEVTELSGVEELRCPDQPCQLYASLENERRVFGIDVGPFCRFNYLGQDKTNKV